MQRGERSDRFDYLVLWREEDLAEGGEELQSSQQQLRLGALQRQQCVHTRHGLGDTTTQPGVQVFGGQLRFFKGVLLCFFSSDSQVLLQCWMLVSKMLKPGL